MIEKLKSRKLWAAILTSALLIFNDHLQILDKDTATRVVAVVASYIVGQAVVDSVGKH